MTRSIKITEIRNINGELHCDNGPAVFDIKKEYVKYYKNGKLHREDGPAVIQPIYVDGCNTIEEWYFDGQLHRSDDNPAVYRTFANPYHSNGYEKLYYKNGKLHREKGPARYLYDPDNDNPDNDNPDNGLMCEWYYEGELHRGNGNPAQYILFQNGDTCCVSYYYHGLPLNIIWIPEKCGSKIKRPLYLGLIKNIPIYIYCGIRNLIKNIF